MPCDKATQKRTNPFSFFFFQLPYFHNIEMSRPSMWFEEWFRTPTDFERLVRVDKVNDKIRNSQSLFRTHKVWCIKRDLIHSRDTVSCAFVQLWLRVRIFYSSPLTLRPAPEPHSFDTTFCAIYLTLLTIANCYWLTQSNAETTRDDTSECHWLAHFRRIVSLMLWVMSD